MKPTGLICLAAASFWLGLPLGCASPSRANNGQPAALQGRAPVNPFLSRGEFSGKHGTVIEKVFRDHRFTRPWLVIRGPDSSTWFVAERCESLARFDRAYIRVTPDDQVTVEIGAYQFVASDWAALGRLFGDFRPEARAMESEISRQLRD